MISNEFFYNQLLKNDIDFYTGVPDSLLKDYLAYISDVNKNNIVSANEGTAIGIAAGYNMSTGKIPVVYMQNSGLGNAINPLTSLTDELVYGIPMLLFVGWRGEYRDEPQHKKMGLITPNLLDILKIPYIIIHQDLSENDLISYIIHAKKESLSLSKPFCFLFKANTFEKYISKNISEEGIYSREEILEEILINIPSNSIIVSTTGVCSREIWEIREKYNQSHESDFLTVGCMGHASSIALGIALNTDKLVYCIDGDGSSIMHLGSYVTNGMNLPKNFTHILLNNGVHDSVGGQNSYGSKISFSAIANNCGYYSTHKITNKVLIKQFLEKEQVDCSFLEITNIKPGFRKNLGRPTQEPKTNKKNFINFINGK